MGKVLVTGGAGYIGSHTVKSLLGAGYEVVVYDNVVNGVAEAVLPPARLVQGELADTERVARLLAEEKFSSIIHFAAHIVVPESLEKPLDYYENNTGNTMRLVRLAVEARVGSFIFSSTAAVYGMPETSPVAEDAPLVPINPYGWSKRFSERIIQDASAAHPGFNHTILRYFNVAGADPDGDLGQNTPQATHLIKVACQVALGMRERLEIYGDDYPTSDGTCIRDYLHVTDLADIHVAALKRLEREGKSSLYNCGYGHGYSVREVVETVKRVSGVDFEARIAPRRPGDPPELVADVSRFWRDFDWRPRHDDLELTVKTALDWERRLQAAARS